MAVSKGRSSKRAASSSSYSSTVTTIVFVTICILGVWMLTSSNSSPTTPSRKAASSKARVDTEAAEDFSDDPPPSDDKGSLSETQEETEGSNRDKEAQVLEESSGGAGEDVSVKGDQLASHATSDMQDEHDEQPVSDSLPTDETPIRQTAQNEDNTAANDVSSSQSDASTEKQEAEQTKDASAGQSENDQEQDNNPEDTKASQTGGSQESEQTSEDVSSTQTSKKESEQNAEETSSNQSENQEPENNTNRESVAGETEQSSAEANSQTQSQHSEQTTEESNARMESEATKQATEETVDTQSESQESQETTDDAASTGESENPETGEKQEGKPNEGNTQTESYTSIPKESKESKKTWSTQADQSENQKERRREEGGGGSSEKDESLYGYTWGLCNVTAGPDYIPCLDNEKAIKKLHSRAHFEHRERHCPEEPPTCLVPLPEGYKPSVEWPKSRDKIWYHNVPHTKLAEVKGHQNWVKVTGEFLTFPGGGTQFIHGALHYIDFLEQSEPKIAWGHQTRVILDVGCGVASFGGYQFERDVLTMSLAPKDEHEAQVQFALERGIPAISAVMGSQRLPFPSRVFDLLHCARCRVPWHAEGGRLLLELNRVLRPGGYFVWSATPVYQKLQEDVEIWKEMSALTQAMCWKLVTIQKDKLNSVGAAVYQKPTTNDCYQKRKHNQPPMCKDDDDPNAAWYVPLQSCMHKVPVDDNERGAHWPEEWPRRLQTPPYWLNTSQMGIYGRPAPDDFTSDYEHWKRVVSKLYLNGLGINWSKVRNMMDMRAVYGGLAAALKDMKLWVLNVVNINSPDTLPVIFERGLFGIYHDWCESFSTYPRTYDLLHADHLFSRVKKRCKIAPLMAEIDRIVRPGGHLIVRDDSATVGEVENLLKSLHWEVHLTFSKDQEGILSAQKSTWRPEINAAAGAASS
uniref:Uncharacterized protein n=1 Tax=Kalanchoe fedtschenkoi TaxID=63787 RepID=A0A7N0UAY5_KALFE